MRQFTLGAAMQAIGHVEKFVEIPKLIVAAVAAGLSLAGLDEGFLSSCLPHYRL